MTHLDPRKLITHLFTWPPRMRGVSPPSSPDAPALFETTVSECRESAPLACIARMIVSAVPHNPKPALNTTEPLFISATASSAFLNSFDEPPAPGIGGRSDSLLGNASLESAVAVRKFLAWMERHGDVQRTDNDNAGHVFSG